MQSQQIEKKDVCIPESKAYSGKNRTKPVVLDEEEYTRSLEKIIERDFFPDVVKLKAKEEYYDALHRNDVVKLRELHSKYNIKTGGESVASSAFNTPATFETPERSEKQFSKSPDRSLQDEPSTKTGDATDVGLDRFLSKHTSEDDASFAELVAQGEARERERHAWLYEQEQERDEKKETRLALPACDKQAEEAGKLTQGLDTWTYRAKNELMYYPEGVERSGKELVEISKAKPKEIVYGNTRFRAAPFSSVKSSHAMHEASNAQAASMQGRIGADGRLLIENSGESATPGVQGYKYLATPSPAPGVEESPLMTWGEIDSTPFRLDGGSTPLTAATPGPTFKIPETPYRDKLAMELAEKSRKQHRDKKKAALRQASASLKSPSPRPGSRGKSLERLSSLSPAARRLASSHFKSSGADKALRASYTPSPRSRRSQDTPTPGTFSLRSTPSNTPSSQALRRSPRTPHTPGTPVDSGLTDDLLQLPKAKRSRR